MSSVDQGMGLELPLTGWRRLAARLAPRPRPWWHWACAAGAAGGLAGAATVWVVRAMTGVDAPGAVPPEQLRAVVAPRQVTIEPDRGSAT